MMQRSNLRDRVRQHLIEYLQEGRQQLHKTINLASMARELGVSVTPVREALTQLQAANIVEAVPNRGFIISRMRRNEAADLYDLLANLEVVALENTSYSPEQLNELARLANILSTKGQSNSIVSEKFKFHRMLTQFYTNDIAQQWLENLRLRVLLYEHTYLNDLEYQTQWISSYAGLVSAIREENVPTASLILKMNWMIGKERMLGCDLPD